MLDYINGFIAVFWEKVVDVFLWLFDNLLDLISGIFYFIYDGFLTLIEGIINGLDFTETAVLNSFNSWDLLPPQVIWLLNYLDLHLILVVLASAFLIRITLNLIPSWATRV